jgi:hypothetical protein
VRKKGRGRLGDQKENGDTIKSGTLRNIISLRLDEKHMAQGREQWEILVNFGFFRHSSIHRVAEMLSFSEDDSCLLEFLTFPKQIMYCLH